MEKRYIFRGNRSGVFYGELGDHSGQEVTIKNCRRLWYWAGAASISEIAKCGVKHPQNCKFTVTVDELVILDCIELIKCTEAACASIDGVRPWTA